MPDPTPTPTPTTDSGPQPQLDPAAIQQAVQASVHQYFQDNPITQPTAAPVARENPIADLINPLVEPSLRNAQLQSNAARDTALFYATHPEAIKHKDELEKVFTGLLEQGTPFDHEAVWAWHRGRNFDKFHAEANEAEQVRIKRAELDATVDGGVRPGGAVVKDAFEASDDELANGLKDVSF